MEKWQDTLKALGYVQMGDLPALILSMPYASFPPGTRTDGNAAYSVPRLFPPPYAFLQKKLAVGETIDQRESPVHCNHRESE